MAQWIIPPGRPNAGQPLKPKQQKRYEKRGITQSQYEGKKRSLKAARGHEFTPEHGLKQAQRNPVEYRKYLNKRERTGGGRQSPEEEGRTINEAKDAAYYTIKGYFQGYRKYDEATVIANVYGGRTSESGDVPGMSLAEARWTSRAPAEAIRARSSSQYTGNPWWYH